MHFITTKTQTTLTALTHQVFDLHGAKSAAAAKQAQAALRAANPHWGEVPKLPAGTLVVVPDVPGLSLSVSPLAAVVSPAVGAQLQQALADAQAVLERSVAATARELETSVSLAKSRDLSAVAKQTPELPPLLAQIAEQSKLQLKQIEAARTAQLQGLTQLEKELGSLNQ